MSLLATSTPDAASSTANQVRNIIKQQFQQLGQSGLRGYNLIWRNPLVTPMEVVTALGVDAKAIFQLAGLNIQTVQAASVIGGVTPPAIPEVPANYSLHFNDDGSATVSIVTAPDSPPTV